eukprot:m.153592 g.153592  ORF g.153592 m.153592 type:complete len:1836 (+) comp17475_c0_seq3:266-5773(+)
MAYRATREMHGSPRDLALAQSRMNHSNLSATSSPSTRQVVSGSRSTTTTSASRSAATTSGSTFRGPRAHAGEATRLAQRGFPVAASTPAPPMKRSNTSPLRLQREAIVRNRLHIYREELAAWISVVLGKPMTEASLLDELDTGVNLCRLALAIQQGMQDAHDPAALRSKPIRFNSRASKGDFFSRDNIACFLGWAKSIGVAPVWLFEANDLVLRNSEKNVLYCLMELGRVQKGVPPPMLIARERALEQGQLSPKERSEVRAAVEAVVQQRGVSASSMDDIRWTYDGVGPFFTMLLRDNVLVKVDQGWETLEAALDSGDIKGNDLEAGKKGSVTSSTKTTTTTTNATTSATGDDKRSSPIRTVSYDRMSPTRTATSGAGAAASSSMSSMSRTATNSSAKNSSAMQGQQQTTTTTTSSSYRSSATDTQGIEQGSSMSTFRQDSSSLLDVGLPDTLLHQHCIAERTMLERQIAAMKESSGIAQAQAVALENELTRTKTVVLELKSESGEKAIREAQRLQEAFQREKADLLRQIQKYQEAAIAHATTEQRLKESLLGEDELRQQLSSVRGELAKQIEATGLEHRRLTDLERELRRAQSDSNAQMPRIAQLEKELSEQLARLSQSSSELEKMRQLSKDLEEQLLQARRDAVVQREQFSASAEQEQLVLRKEIDALRADIDRLQGQLSRSQSQQSDELAEARAAAQRKENDAASQIASLKSQLSELTSRYEEELKAKRQGLSAADDLERQREDAARRLAEATQTIQELMEKHRRELLEAETSKADALKQLQERLASRFDEANLRVERILEQQSADRQEIADLHSQLLEAQAEISRLRDLQDHLEKQSGQQSREWEAKAATRQAELERLLAEAKAAHSSALLDMEQAKLAMTREFNDKTRQMIEEAENALVDRHRQELEALKAAHEARIRELQAAQEEAERRHGDKARSVEGLEEELQRQLAEASRKMQELQEAHDADRQKLYAQHNQALADLNKQWEERLADAASSSTGSLDAIKANFEAQRATLAEELAKLKGEISDLTGRLEQAVRETKSEEAEKLAVQAKLDTTTTQLDATMAELEAARAKLASLEESMRQTNAESGEQAGLIAELRARIAELEASKGQLEAALEREAAAALERQQELELKIADLQRQLLEERESAQAQQKSIEDDHSRERDAMQADMDRLAAELEAAKSAAAGSQEGFLAQLDQLKQAHQEELATRDAAAAEAEEQHRAALEQLEAEWRKKLENAESHSRSLGDDASAVQQQLAAIQADLDAARQELDAEKQRYLSLQAEFDQYKIEIVQTWELKLQETIQVWELKYEELTIRLSEVEAERDEARRILDDKAWEKDFEAQMSAITAQLAEVKAQRDQDKAEADARIQELEDENERLRQRIAELEALLEAARAEGKDAIDELRRRDDKLAADEELERVRQEEEERRRREQEESDRAEQDRLDRIAAEERRIREEREAEEEAQQAVIEAAMRENRKWKTEIEDIATEADDIASWFNALFPKREKHITHGNLFTELTRGTLLCELMELVDIKEDEARAAEASGQVPVDSDDDSFDDLNATPVSTPTTKRKAKTSGSKANATSKTKRTKKSSGLHWRYRPPVGESVLKDYIRGRSLIKRPLRYNRNARKGTAPARENVKQFLEWTKKLGFKDNLFEVDDIMKMRNPRRVLYALYDVARRTRNMRVPRYVWFERRRKLPGYRVTKGDELDELVASILADCICQPPFRIRRTGPGKYAVADAKMPLLIKQSGQRVVVRVGGGWEDFGEHCKQLDKCRADDLGHKALIKYHGKWKEHDQNPDQQYVDSMDLPIGFYSTLIGVSHHRKLKNKPKA